MAKSIRFRTFSEGGDEVRFSSILFRGKLNEWKEKKKKQGQKATKEKAYEMIAEKAHVSIESVKNWEQGNNGPNDYQTVKQIASALEIEYTDLIVPAREEPKSLEQNFDPESNNEKALLIQIYKLFIDYIYWFIGTEDDSYALRMLERPEDDRKDYIWNLYHFLDQIALSVSQDTYRKLHKLITHLDVFSASYFDSEMMLPDLWYKLNPDLMPVTNSLFDADKTLSEVMENSFRTNWDYQSVEEENTEKTTYDEKKRIFHNIEDDLLDYSDYLTKKDNVNKEKGIALIETIYIDEGEKDYLIYQIVSREVAATLTKVMRYYFPQHFGQE